MNDIVKPAALLAVTAIASDILDACEIALIGTDFSWTFDLVAADLTFVAATGLAPRAAGTFSAPYEVSTGIIETSAPSIAFIAGAIASPVLAYGYALTNADQTVLHAVVHFEEPLSWQTVSDGNVIVPRVRVTFAE